MGYYGYGNIGDDLFVKQLTNYFHKKEKVKNIFLICKDTYYEGLSEKTSLFNSLRLTKIPTISLLLKSDCIVWGGGSLKLESKPMRNLLRLQAFCKLTRKRFCFLGIGLEGLKAGKEKGVTKVFEDADLLYVRDNHSYKLAHEELKSTKYCCLGGDLAFLDLTLYEDFLNKKKNSNALNNISFSGKFWWGEGRAEFYAQQLMQLIEKYNSVIHLLPAHVGDEKNDNRFHELLKKYLPMENCKLHSWNKPEDFLEILNQMDFHFGDRLHSVILADILGVPNIGIGNYPDKISNYIEKTGMLAVERLATFMEPLALERIEKIFQQYKRPDEFILNESRTSKESLEKFFQMM